MFDLTELRHRRHESGLTLQEVADWAGVSAATISRWERGETPVTLDHLNRLALLYGARVALVDA